MTSLESQLSSILSNGKEKLITIRCDKCINIPKINLRYNEENNIEVEKRCNNNHKKKMSLKDFLDENYFHLENAVCRKCRRKISSYYCYDCKDFICENCQYNQHDSRHKIIDKNKYDYTCIEHHKKYNSYCKTCEKNLCTECVNKHKYNNCIIYFYKDCSFDSNKINMELKKNDEVIKKVISIKKEIVQSLNQYLNQLTKKFEKFIEDIRLENELIIRLISIFEKNKFQLNYEIIYNYENTVICYPNNFENLLKNDSSLNIYDKIIKLNDFFSSASDLIKEKIKQNYNKNIITIHDNYNNNTIITNDIPRIQTKFGNDIPRIQTKIGNDIPRIQTIFGNDIPRIQTIFGNDIPRIQTKKENKKIITINNNKEKDLTNEDIKNNYYSEKYTYKGSPYYSLKEKSYITNDWLTNTSIFEYEIYEDDEVNCIIELKNKYISVGLKNGNINIYSNQNFKKVISMKEHKNKIVSIIEFKNGNLLSASLDKLIKVSQLDYNNNKYEVLETYDKHYEEINYVIELSSGFVISTSDSKFLLWTQNSTIDYTKEKSGDKVRKIIELKNGKIIMNHYDYFTIWEERNSELIKFEETYYYKSNSILLNEIKDNIYIIGNKNEFKIMDGNYNCFIEIIKINFQITNCLSINNEILLVCYENHIYKFNMKNLEELKPVKQFLQIYDNQINNIIKLSNNLIAIYGDSKIIKFFDKEKFN